METDNRLGESNYNAYILRDLPDPGIKTSSLASPALAGGFFATVPPGKAHLY